MVIIFEDSIVFPKKVDKKISLLPYHIEEIYPEVRDTKRGIEELTNTYPKLVRRKQRFG
jgi:DNA-directed RNA polymerase beta subunit